MSTVEANPFISAPVRDLVGTSAASESPNTRDYGREDAFREAWRKIIDGRLIEWGCYPAKLADEGVDPPTAETLKLAIDLAGQLRGTGWLPQTVPDCYRAPPSLPEPWSSWLLLAYEVPR